MDFVSSLFSIAFLATVLRMTLPYAMAALGGSFSERSGVINIALEGKLLVGAFTATLGAYYSGSVAVGVLAGVAGGVAVGALYGLVVITFRADQIVAGVAINMMAYGLTRYLLQVAFGSASNSPDTVGFGFSVFDNPVFWAAVFTAFATWWVMFYTPYGLRLRAVGDHPEAADTLGVSVARVRWTAVLVAGGLAGFGGAWMSLGTGEFTAAMSGGRGYIALAAVIMGRWHPLWAVGACLLFGTASALEIQMAQEGLGLPDEILETFPYVLTMVTLAGFMGRSRAPAALGKPYEPG